jgi:hypothetical protein
MKNKSIKLISALALSGVFLTSFNSELRASTPGKGIYDGIIENQKIILVVDESDSLQQKGYYILNQGKSIEDTHSFILQKSKKKVLFQSDLYSGAIKGGLTDSTIEGMFSFYNRPKKLLFFYQKGKISFNKREEITVSPSGRYKEEIFSKINITKDIKYGKAVGYWNSNPYNNEPYIEVITKSISNTLKDPDSLDLKLDIYRPVNDPSDKRPLVLLIHGGAFYIGTKQCPTMILLATTLAKRGYTVASIDYRLGFKLRGSDIERSGFRAIQDAHAALRFLSRYSQVYGIDTTQVYIGGTSAGAIASLNLAFMDNDERPESVQSKKKSEDLGKIESSGNNLRNGFTLRGVANMWGAVTDINIIDKDEVIPVLSIHGTADDIVPYDYDYPFQDAPLINRMLMDKMYGSKAVHDRLNTLGIKNKLISFEGLKHEPQTDKFNNMNNLMDTISNNVTKFFYELTAPSIFVPEKQLAVSKNSPVVPVYSEISNGELIYSEVKGGVKLNSNPKDLSIIWFKNSQDKELTLYSKNNFDAWTIKSFKIKTDN